MSCLCLYCSVFVLFVEVRIGSIHFSKQASRMSTALPHIAIECASPEGVRIILLGTAHISMASVKDVYAITRSQPLGAVLVEICKRFDSSSGSPSIVSATTPFSTAANRCCAFQWALCRPCSRSLSRPPRRCVQIEFNSQTFLVPVPEREPNEHRCSNPAKDSQVCCSLP